MEKVAERAGKAAPAVAIAGALVAMPHANAAVKAPAKATAAAVKKPAKATAVEQVRTDAVVRQAQPAARTYIVQAGDTLSALAEHYFDNAGDWPSIYQANTSVISDPNLIYVGEQLDIPYGASAAASYTPRHAKATAQAVVMSSSAGTSSAGTSSGATSSAGSLSGTLSCSGLEALWESAGGSPSEAFMAAEIAMAESGGQQYALSPSDDFGYWQINGSHGSLATYDPYGNARAAVTISSDGTDWSPWTTYVTGAYQGRC
ncbi:MAG: LysM peptidoglycan-binding domain-containing protein [Actinobacteria bacterium]|nr:LysM peptidoglycan-binding domain-containing protein [Actinomycetota bacterium]